MNKITEKIQANKLYLISLVLSIFTALVIGAILMLILGYNPFEGYGSMVSGAFGNSRVFGNTLAKMLTLCLTGLAMAVAAKAGMFNVGGEGQLFLGGLAATMAGVWLQGVPVIVALPLAFLSAALVGGFYAWVPAILKVKLGVSEVITTIMLNSVAIYLCSYLVNSGGPFATTDKGIMGGSDAVPQALRFAQLIPRSNLSTALIYSAFIAFLCWYIMEKTSVGLEMKITGENEKFAFFVGLKKDKLMIWSMIASGVICGLVGMFEVYGYQNRFMETISNEFYYDGMLVAMIMNYSPLGIVIMSFFFAIIDIGSASMELAIGVPRELSDILFSIIIFLMAAQGGLTRYFKDRSLQRKAKERINNKEACQ